MRAFFVRCGTNRSMHGRPRFDGSNSHLAIVRPAWNEDSETGRCAYPSPSHAPPRGLVALAAARKSLADAKSAVVNYLRALARPVFEARPRSPEQSL